MLSKPISKWPQAVCFVGGIDSLIKNVHIDQKKITLSFDRLLLEDTRSIKKVLVQKVPNNEHNLLIIKASSIGIEAQNSLLKIIEEPAVGHKIVFCMPSIDGMLETVLSRCLIVFDKKTKSNDKSKRSLLPWINKNPLERIKEAEKWIKESQKKQKMPEFRAELLTMMVELEKFLYAKKDSLATLKELSSFRIYLQSQSASPKYLLEYLALLLSSS